MALALCLLGLLATAAPQSPADPQEPERLEEFEVGEPISWTLRASSAQVREIGWWGRLPPGLAVLEQRRGRIDGRVELERILVADRAGPMELAGIEREERDADGATRRRPVPTRRLLIRGVAEPPLRFGEADPLPPLPRDWTQVALPVASSFLLGGLLGGLLRRARRRASAVAPAGSRPPAPMDFRRDPAAAFAELERRMRASPGRQGSRGWTGTELARELRGRGHEDLAGWLERGQAVRFGRRRLDADELAALERLIQDHERLGSESRS